MWEQYEASGRPMYMHPYVRQAGQGLQLWAQSPPPTPALAGGIAKRAGQAAYDWARSPEGMRFAQDVVPVWGDQEQLDRFVAEVQRVKEQGGPQGIQDILPAAMEGVNLVAPYAGAVGAIGKFAGVARPAGGQTFKRTATEAAENVVEPWRVPSAEEWAQPMRNAMPEGWLSAGSQGDAAILELKQLTGFDFGQWARGISDMKVKPVVSINRNPNADLYRFSVLFKDPQTGRQVGVAHRKIDLRNNEIYNEYFKLARSMQGQGLARQLLRSQIDMARQLGIRYMTLDATLDRGAYAWARKGALPGPDAWNSGRFSVKAQLRQRAAGMNMPEDVEAMVRGALASDDPRAIRDLANIQVPTGELTPAGRPVTWGNKLLSGLSYPAYFDLHDPKVLEMMTQ